MILDLENRLIFRRASDFADKTKYNSRTAEANVVRQQTGVAPARLTEAKNVYIPQPEPPSEGDRLQTIAALRGQARLEGEPLTTTDVQRIMSGGASPKPVTRIQELENDLSKPAAPGIPSEQYPGQRSTELANEASIRASKAQELKALKDAENAKKGSAAVVSDTTGDKKSGGIDLLSVSLPDELQPLAQILKDQKASYDDAIRTQKEAAGQYDSFLQQSKDDNKAFFDTILSGYEKDKTDMKDMLETIRADVSQRVLDEQASSEALLNLQEQKQTRQMEKAKAELVDKMTISLAIRGGFGSVVGNQEISEAEFEAEEAITEMQNEFELKKAQVSLQYTNTYKDIQNKYALDVLTTVKEFNANKNQILLQSHSSQSALDEKLAANHKDLSTNITNLKLEKAKAITDQAIIIRQMLSEEKTAQRQKEADALDKIEYLSGNYAPEEVSDAIRELSKDVKSFDASTLAGIPPIDVAAKLKKARGGAGGGIFIPGQDAKPVQTYDEFIQDKIEEKEADMGMSLSPKARKEYIESNKVNFMLEYKAGSSSIDNAPSSGDSSVDEVAGLVVSGIYPDAKTASNETGIPSIAIARQVKVLQTHGAAGGAVPMSPAQEKQFRTIVDKLQPDERAQFARSVPYKISAMKIGLNKRNGAADILDRKSV